MATSKKEFYSIYFAPSCALRLSLDPDIYSGVICFLLGIDEFVIPLDKILPVNLKQARASAFAVGFKVIVSKGDQLRTIDLICSTAKAATAKEGLIGLTISLGYGNNATSWTIREVR